MKPTTRMSRKKPIATRPKSPICRQRDRPREEERDLQIEHDEQDGDEVVPHVEFHAGVFVGLEAALIRRDFLSTARACGREDDRFRYRAPAGRSHHGTHDKEDQNRKVVREHDHSAIQIRAI